MKNIFKAGRDNMKAFSEKFDKILVIVKNLATLFL